jgi:hypothetical protein
MAEPLILFVHVPKTAGNTLRAILHRQYGRAACLEIRWGPDMPPVPHLVLTADVPYLTPWYRDRIQPGQAWYPEPLPSVARRFQGLPEERRCQIRVIRGHMTFGLDRYLPGPAAYFTLLRNPVDQVLSAYYYSTGHEPTVDDLYEQIAARLESNMQTWIMAGPHDSDLQLPPGEMLARAQDNLRACAVVGLTERFDETLLLLRRAFGWRWPFYVRRNVNRQRPSASATPVGVQHRVEADNTLDVALYAAACERFEAQIAAYGPSFERHLRLFRAMNAAWQRGHRFKRRLRRASSALARPARGEKESP